MVQGLAREVGVATMPGRVLFVIPDLFQDDIHLPLGPAYLSAVLRQAGAEV